MKALWLFLLVFWLAEVVLLKDCKDEEWECDNGDCIPKYFLCDGSKKYGHNVHWYDDCSDESDELWEVCCDVDHYDYEKLGTYTKEFCNKCAED